MKSAFLEEKTESMEKIVFESRARSSTGFGLSKSGARASRGPTDYCSRQCCALVSYVIQSFDS